MPLTYPTTYTDNRGTEQSHFITDGQSMRITLRGIEFVGHFYELYPIPEHLEKAKELFDLTENIYEGNEVDYSIGTNTPGYSLSVQIPIKIITLENTEEDAIIDFGVNPTKIDFIIQGKVFPSKSPNIEYGISEEYTSSFKIKHVKCFVNCKFGAFFPAGSAEYGDMMCFKNCKDAWSKIGYTGLKDPSNWSKLSASLRTQEAFWCGEFVRAVVGS